MRTSRRDVIAETSGRMTPEMQISMRRAGSFFKSYGEQGKGRLRRKAHSCYTMPCPVWPSPLVSEGGGRSWQASQHYVDTPSKHTNYRAAQNTKG